MEKDESKIDKLKKALYSRNSNLDVKHLLDLHSHEDNVSHGWENNSVEAKESEENPIPFDVRDGLVKTKFLQKILIGAGAFFIFSALLAFYIFFKQDNVVSADKIDVVVIAPAKASSGEETSFDIEITNNNDTLIELTDVVVEYPKGTKGVDQDSLDLPRERVSFGTIPPKQTSRQTIKAILFGEEGSLQRLALNLEYHVPGSTSVFKKEGFYDISIGTGALALSVDGIKEITSGQEITLKAEVKSNSTEIIRDVLLKVSTPFGFTITSASPQPVGGTTYWKLGDIEPSGVRTITIKGKVVGETDDVRFFKFALGTSIKEKPGEIEALIASLDHSFEIKKPFLGAMISFNQQSAESLKLTTGELITAEVDWKNNINTPVNDVSIEVVLSGSILNKKNIKSSKGIVRTQEGKIYWTKSEDPNLEQISSGGGGTVAFTFDTFPARSKEAENLRNQEISVALNMKGRRISESDVPEEITSTIFKKIKVQTDISLTSQVVHGSGLIENQGPIPPKVDTPTEYAVIWTVSNTLNDVSETKVEAVLPSYVDWTGITTPQAEKISYDEASRKITWDLGKVLATGGSVSGFRQVSFQVRLTPSSSQVGEAPIIVDAPTLTGTDSFTGASIKYINKGLTTVISTDPEYDYGDERVVE